MFIVGSHCLPHHFHYRPYPSSFSLDVWCPSFTTWALCSGLFRRWVILLHSQEVGFYYVICQEAWRWYLLWKRRLIFHILIIRTNVKSTLFQVCLISDGQNQALGRLKGTAGRKSELSYHFILSFIFSGSKEPWVLVQDLFVTCFVVSALSLFFSRP